MIAKIVEITKTVCKTDGIELNEDTSISSDLELMSMEFLAFVAEIDNFFGIRIKERELRNIDTLGELAELVSEKID